MVFETGMFSAAMSVSGERFTTSMEKHVQQFDERFENTFQLKNKVGEGRGGVRKGGEGKGKEAMLFHRCSMC